MLRNRLLFSQNDKNKSQARTAISRKPRAAHNISLRSKPKAKLAAILPALVVAFTGTVAAGSTFSAMAAITRMDKYTLTQKKMLKRTLP